MTTNTTPAQAGQQDERAMFQRWLEVEHKTHRLPALVYDACFLAYQAGRASVPLSKEAKQLGTRITIEALEQERARGYREGRASVAAASTAPSGEIAAEPVAYLDIGSAGYVDVGSDLTDEQLAALPRGRHMLAIIGTYGVDGYQPASSVAAQAAEDKRDAERFRELLASPSTLIARKDAIRLDNAVEPEALAHADDAVRDAIDAAMARKECE